jgi:hypothetical protein
MRAQERKTDMDETLKLILQILGLAITAAGMIVVGLAARIVDKKGLAEKKQIDPALLEHYSPEDQAKMRRDAAITDIKLRGAVLAVPGLILILIAFR